MMTDQTYSKTELMICVAARLYQGQTTNFRTPGGGFSPVVVLPALEPAPTEILSTPLSIHQALTATP
jgi:hypothetical protein